MTSPLSFGYHEVIEICRLIRSAFCPKLSSFQALLVACGQCSLPALKVQRSARLYCSPSLVKW
jgi:hypothetical protein